MLVEHGLLTKSQLKAFSGSVNNDQVFGDHARHQAEPNRRLPTATINLKEAQILVRDVIDKWFAMKLGKQVVPQIGLNAMKPNAGVIPDYPQRAAPVYATA